jgi:four helix bundle protein
LQNFKNLKVWDKAHRLTLDLYRCTQRFPKQELFGLTSQIRRCGTSIGANIAEGCGRTDAEFGRFLQIAVGSASELQYHLLLSRDLELLSEQEYARLSTEASDVKRMLVTLLSRVRTANLE